MHTKPCLLILLFFLVMFSSFSVFAEEEAQKTGTFKVDLENGSFYNCHVPEDYQPDGTWGAILVLHGAGGSSSNMLAHYISRTNFLAENKYIGVSAKSLGQAWRGGESTPMDSLNDVMKKYKIDKNRLHVLGYSSGGFFAGWLGFDEPELFRTVTIIAAFLARTNMGSVKKHIQKPVYFIAGENDPNLAGAKTDYQNMLRMGAKYARLLEVPGQGHNGFPFQNHFPMLFNWYKAMESGFDYATALEKAEKSLRSKYKKSMEIVAEIEKHPPEEQFWLKLKEIKAAINVKGEKKLKSLLSRLKGKKPEEAIKKLKEFEATFAGYEVAEKAALERKKCEEKQEAEKKAEEEKKEE